MSQNIINKKYDDSFLKVPERTPKEFIDHIKPYIENKIVCDVGAGAGDLSVEMAKYAKHVFAIENGTSYPKGLEYLRTRILPNNVTFIENNVLTMKLPIADVYYVFLNIRIPALIYEQIDTGILIVALGDKWGKDLQHEGNVEISNKILSKCSKIVKYDFDNSENISMKYWNKSAFGVIYK